jgi:hypothetical protein
MTRVRAREDDRASQPRPRDTTAGSVHGRELQLLDVRRMLAEAPPPVQWRIEGLAIDGCLTMLAGREGQGKSMLSLALACATTEGREVAGMACRQGRALVVDVENGEYEAHRRVHGLRPHADRLSYCVDPVRLPDDLDLVDDLVARVSPDLVVMDSLRPMCGAADENDSRMDVVLAPLRDMTRAWGAACILLHHAPKSGDDYRGSTSIGAAVELGFTMASAGAAGTKRLRCWKSRPAPEPADRWLSIRQGAGGAPEVVEADAPAVTALPMDDMASRIVAALAGGPMRRADLAEAVGEPREQPGGTFTRALKDAVARGTVFRPKLGVYALAGVTV